jgi:hypothetical protein
MRRLNVRSFSDVAGHAFACVSPYRRTTDGQIREGGFEERRVHNATAEARNPEEQLRAEGHEPQAGHSDWAQRSAEQGGQGAVAQVVGLAQVIGRSQIVRVAQARVVEPFIVESEIVVTQDIIEETLTQRTTP